MVEQLDFMEINSLIKHFLKQQGYTEALQTFDAETNDKILKNQ